MNSNMFFTARTHFADVRECSTKHWNLASAQGDTLAETPVPLADVSKVALLPSQKGSLAPEMAARQASRQ